MENGVENSAGPKKLEARRIFFGELKAEAERLVFEYEGVGLGFGIELSRGGRLGVPPIVRLVRDKNLCRLT